MSNFISQNRAQTTKQTNPTFKLRNYKIPTSWEYFFCDREKVESYGDLGFIVAGWETRLTATTAPVGL